MEGIIGDQDLEGIIPRTIKDTFEFIRNTTESIEFTVKISMVEIYMEKVMDLIDPSRKDLNIREDKVKGIFIEDLSEHYVGCEEEVLELIKLGSENRTTGETKMNAVSSRSHSIFAMTIHQNNITTNVAKTGKLFLVDLAGSEKVSKTEATGLLLEQAKKINCSLTTLGMVINNLTDGKSSHIPYRDSKLTRALQESLGGNAKTCLIITCSPSIFNHQETLSTLRFGERAKKIKNKPKINKETTVAELKVEIEKLENTITKQNKRIIQLCQFIEKNGLKIPDENDFDFLKEKQFMDNLTDVDVEFFDDDNNITNKDNKFKEDLIMKNNIFNLSTPNKNEILSNNKLPNLNTILNQSPNPTPSPNINNFKLYDNNFDLFNSNNNSNKSYKKNQAFSIGRFIMDHNLNMNFEEDDKKNVSEKLDNAILTIKNFDLPDKEKSLLQRELEEIKNKHELIEQNLYEKINDLQEKLDLEKRAINKVDRVLNDKDKNLSAFSFEEEKEIGNEGKLNNNNIDKYDIFEESNKNSNTLNNNFNNKQYSLNENEGEIIKKVKEIMADLQLNEDFNKICPLIENKNEANFEENENVNVNVNDKENDKDKDKEKDIIRLNNFNTQKIKIVELFDLIKDKLFDNNMKINYNFEDNSYTNANNNTNANNLEIEKIEAEKLNEKYRSKIKPKKN